MLLHFQLYNQYITSYHHQLSIFSSAAKFLLSISVKNTSRKCDIFPKYVSKYKIL
jgi:hypothetical protein